MANHPQKSRRNSTQKSNKAPGCSLWIAFELLLSGVSFRLLLTQWAGFTFYFWKKSRWFSGFKINVIKRGTKSGWKKLSMKSWRTSVDNIKKWNTSYLFGNNVRAWIIVGSCGSTCECVSSQKFTICGITGTPSSGIFRNALSYEFSEWILSIHSCIEN